MERFGEIALHMHIVFGSLGLAAFWVPVLTEKGASLHKRYGNIFLWSTYIVLGTAAISILIRFISLGLQGLGPDDRPLLYGFLIFLSYLAVIVFVVVRHGVLVLKAKQDLQRLNTRLNTALAWAIVGFSIFVILYGLILNPPNQILLFALSPIGIISGIDILRYIRGKKTSKREWMYEHLGAMLGAGIAFHTAFFVFGASQLFNISGPLSVIPWIAPTLIGIPTITIWTRHYRQKFGEAS